VRGKARSSELVLSALVRARFCELLSLKVQHGQSDLFLMGLLSVMDAILDVPMPEVLDKVPVDHETKAVLLGQASHLRPFYQLMLALESADWQHTAQLSQAMGLSETDVAHAHWEAMQWARQVSSS
jgi:c-di-GMP-related signal transduction protein